MLKWLNISAWFSEWKPPSARPTGYIVLEAVWVPQFIYDARMQHELKYAYKKAINTNTNIKEIYKVRESTNEL